MSDVKSIMERYYSSFVDDENKPRFNHGECGKTCNCIEIAESKNGGEPVKGYACLAAECLDNALKK